MKLTDATALFEQLDTFSQRVFALWKLPLTGSANGPASMTTPRGVVIHYTAGTFESSIKWFCDPAQNSEVSAHMVVGRQRYVWAEPLLKGLPLVQALPVTVVQCRRPTLGASHATWVNHLCWGIENECMGFGPLDQGVNYPIKDPMNPRTFSTCDGKPWDTYPAIQVAANVTLVQAYQALAGPTFSSAWVIGHEHVETLATVGYPNNKRDPGPMFPLGLVRDAACGDAGKATLTLASAIASGDPGFEVMARRGLILAPFVTRGTTLASAWQQALNGLLFLNTSVATIPACRALLALLGYLAPGDPFATTLSDVELESVYLAQTALGLVADKKPGPKTLQALQNRLRDRFG